MAKVPVVLFLDGMKDSLRQVASFRMSFFQTTDVEGQVTDLPRGGKITMKLKALNNGNVELIHWMVDKKKVFAGYVEFRNTKTDSLMKKYNFKDAYCVSYTESWDDSNKNDSEKSDPNLMAHWEEITISCREIKVDAMDLFKNTWELV